MAAADPARPVDVEDLAYDLVLRARAVQDVAKADKGGKVNGTAMVYVGDLKNGAEGLDPVCGHVVHLEVRADEIFLGHDLFAVGVLPRRMLLEDLDQVCCAIPSIEKSSRFKRHTRVGLVAITVADLGLSYCSACSPNRRPWTVLMLLAFALRVAIRFLLPYFSAQNSTLPVSRTYRYRPGFPLAAIVSPSLYSTSSNLFNVFFRRSLSFSTERNAVAVDK